MTAKITLEPQNGDPNIVLSAEEFDDGDFDWTIGTDIKLGTYKIKIEPNDTTHTYGPYESDAFTIIKGIFGPAPQEEWVRGESTILLWEPGDDTQATAKFDLLTTDGTIVKTWNIPNTGKAEYKVPPDLEIDAYRLRVSVGNLVSTTPDTFDVVGYVSFNVPAEGTVWKRGSRVIIEWDAARPDEIGYVTLALYKGETGSQVQALMLDLKSDNDGFYVWDIPVNITPGTDYSLKIQVTDTDHIAESSLFTILSNPFYLDNPNEGDDFLTYDFNDVTWDNEVQPNKFVTCQLFQSGAKVDEWLNLPNSGHASLKVHDNSQAGAGRGTLTCFWVSQPSKTASVNVVVYDALVVNSPNSSDHWQRNRAEAYIISWDTGCPTPEGEVKISLWSKLGAGGSLRLVIVESTENDGDYPWIPQDLLSDQGLEEGQYTIRIEDIVQGSDKPRIAYSEVFSIVPGPFNLEVPAPLFKMTLKDFMYNNDLVDAHQYGNFSMSWEPGTDKSPVQVSVCCVKEGMATLDESKCATVTFSNDGGNVPLNLTQVSYAFNPDYRVIRLTQGTKSIISIPFFVGPFQETEVTAPHENEVLTRGTNYAVKWTIGGKPVEVWTTVSMTLKSNDSGFQEVDLVDDDDNDGLFPWDIPGDLPVGSGYYITIEPDERWEVLAPVDSDYFTIKSGKFAIVTPDPDSATPIVLEEYVEPKGYKFDLVWENEGKDRQHVLVTLTQSAGGKEWLHESMLNTGRYTVDCDFRMTSGLYMLCVKNEALVSKCSPLIVVNSVGVPGAPASSKLALVISVIVGVVVGLGVLGVAGFFAIRFYKQKKWGGKTSGGSYVPLTPDSKGYTAPAAKV